ncbi:MAG: thiamine pyrophosphate-dependent dehydrogenase E1 component subunit alpha [Magnetococcales bacterium]|nr:thiamine pyrophosphate-dependent dehydrogenase E1 component subunit alpha [Magnetococcales bacterium]
MSYYYTGNGFQDWTANEVAHVEPTTLLALYYSMLRIRRVEEEIESRYHQDHMKTPIHLMIGQEASSVGVCAALTQQDFIFSSHRTHGNYLAKGGDLKAMLCELHCRANGCVGSRGGSMHLLDKKVGMAGSSAIVAGSVPMATGAALSAQLLGEERVSVAFLGDAASEEGVVWECLNFAVLKKLPVLYVCENNFYSVCSPLSHRQPPGIDIYQKAAAFGVHAQRVDGVNVVEVFQAARQAVAAIRQGEGPYFLEVPAYRWRGHHGSGDDSGSGYRSFQEGEVWHHHCPVHAYAAFLQRIGILQKSQQVAMEEEIRREIQEAFEFALASPLPEAESLYDYAYAI